jgi:hypothetical protein
MTDAVGRPTTQSSSNECKPVRQAICIRGNSMGSYTSLLAGSVSCKKDCIHLFSTYGMAWLSENACCSRSPQTPTPLPLLPAVADWSLSNTNNTEVTPKAYTAGLCVGLRTASLSCDVTAISVRALTCPSTAWTVISMLRETSTSKSQPIGPSY